MGIATTVAKACSLHGTFAKLFARANCGVERHLEAWHICLICLRVLRCVRLTLQFYSPTLAKILLKLALECQAAV